MRNTLVLHNCLDISKIKIDKSRNIDKVCYSLNCLLQYLICLLECVRHGCPSVNYLKELVIRYNDKCINTLLKLLYSAYCVIHSLLSLELKRLSDNTDCEDSHILGNLSDNRSCTCTGTSTHSAGNKYHICTLECLGKLFCVLLCCLLTNLRLSSGTKSLSKLLTYLKCCRSLTELKCLLICVNSYKLNATYILINHSVNGIISCSTYSNHYNLSRCFCIIINLNYFHCERNPPYTIA